jgi:hypothetical protein
MCAIVFEQIKLRSCPIICRYVLVPLILKVDVSMLLEVLVDVSAPLVLKIRCFSTSRTASGYFRPYRTTSECFNISDIKTDVSIPLDAQGFISVPLEPQLNVSVPLKQQMNVSAHNATYH